MLKKFVDMKAQIWGSESHACSIVFEVASGRYYAVCDELGEEKRLTEKNCERVLNDLFYDYCIAKAAWMGVS